MDICANKHKGNEQSVAANKKVNKEIDRNFILKYFEEHKTAYLKQVAKVMGKQLNQISGRFSELKAANIIEDSGSRKEGCTVYQLIEKDNNGLQT